MNEKDQYGKRDQLHNLQPENNLDPETDLILASLSEARPSLNEKPGEYIIKSAQTDKPLVVLMGPPGNGKSTVIEELSRVIDGDKTYALYDNYLSDFEGDHGPRVNYSKSEWLALNKVISDDILRLKYEKKDPSEKRVILAEVPGVGSTEVRDVGVTATRRLFEDAAENGGTLFVYIVSNPLLEEFSGLLRQAVELAKPDEVLDILAKHNIRMRDVDDPVAVGKKIKDAFGKSAKTRHIERIRGEIKREIADWATKRSNENFTKAHLKYGDEVDRDPATYDPRKINREGIQGPPGVTVEKINEIYESFNEPIHEWFQDKMTNSLIEECIDQAMYMENIFKQYKLKKDQALILYKEFYPGVITTDPAYISLHSG